MKISKLITILSAIQARYGDIDVSCAIDSGSLLIPRGLWQRVMDVFRSSVATRSPAVTMWSKVYSFASGVTSSPDRITI